MAGKSGGNGGRGRGEGASARKDPGEGENGDDQQEEETRRRAGVVHDDHRADEEGAEEPVEDVVEHADAAHDGVGNDVQHERAAGDAAAGVAKAEENRGGEIDDRMAEDDDREQGDGEAEDGARDGGVGARAREEAWENRAGGDGAEGEGDFAAGDGIARHPSQLYQFGLEGLLLFAVLWWFARRERRLGEVSAAFLIGYGSLRFIAEYFREPDSFLGLRALNLSQGQWLCVPMVAAGLLIWAWARHRTASRQPA